MNKYIDVKDFKEWIENWFYKHKTYHPYAKTNNIPITELYDILEQMPAADVAEVRHGRWENEIDTGTEMMACSVCGARVVKHPYITAVGRKGYAYCPYCGALLAEPEDTYCTEENCPIFNRDLSCERCNR